MAKSTRGRYYVGGYVAGWRDQECPVCGAKWFVSASTHVFKIHGTRMPGLSSSDLRFNRKILLEELNHFSMDPKAMAQRHRRWVQMILEEQADGGAYIKRLARRWKISYAAASSRINEMARLGSVHRTRTPQDGRLSPKDATSRCKRGHLRTGDNLYIDPRGSRVCLACVRERHRLREEAKGRTVVPRPNGRRSTSPA